MRIVWIWPRIWTSSSNCWAPNSPRIVGLSHVFSRIGNGGSSGRWRSSGGVFTTHEINAWQGVCWSGEGKATVEITWPNGIAEWSGGPQATGIAQDWLQWRQSKVSVKFGKTQFPPCLQPPKEKYLSSSNKKPALEPLPPSLQHRALTSLYKTLPRAPTLLLQLNAPKAAGLRCITAFELFSLQLSRPHTCANLSTMSIQHIRARTLKLKQTS